MRLLASALLVLSAALSVEVHAQTSSLLTSLAPGARVRVTHPGEGTRVATVVAVTADTLALEWARQADTVRMPLDQVTRIDISRGMQADSRLARTGIGFMIGTGAGLLLGLASAHSCSGGDMGCALGEGVAAMFLAGVGGTTGAVVGAVTSGQHERWDRVPLPSHRVGISVVPGVGGRGLGLRVSLSPAGS